MKIINYTSLLIALSISFSFSTLATPSGWVVGWGGNISGNVTGIPYSGNSIGVVVIADHLLTNAVAVSAGNHHSLAIKSDGTVVGWGDNFGGQAIGIKSTYPPYRDSGVVTIDGQTLSNVVAISACQFSAALKHDGTVTVWGRDDIGRKIEVPSDLTNVIAVSVGEEHCLVLKKDGMLINMTSKGVTPLDGSNVVAIATGRSYGAASAGSDLALKNDGTAVGLYASRIEYNPFPKEMTNIMAIAKGGAATFALTKDGRVFGKGINDKGQATGAKTTNSIVSGYVTINGQLLTNVTAIAAGGDMNLALKQDGTVVAWGGIGMFGTAGKPTVPTGLSNVVAIAAGYDYCLAITTNRAVAEKFMH